MGYSPRDAHTVAALLAAQLPARDVLVLAERAELGPDALADLQATAGSPALRDACQQVIDCLVAHKPEYVAGCLAGAAAGTGLASRGQTVDVVWTGPASEVDTMRLTSAVVAELIAMARADLLLVSYATFPEHEVVSALKAACGRGIDVTMVVERQVDNPRYTASEDGLTDLPVRRVVWPQANRPPGAALHPKLVVVDKNVALVGSANLTGRAFSTNLECGVLIRGGPAPRAISDHIWSLVHAGVLAVLPG